MASPLPLTRVATLEGYVRFFTKIGAPTEPSLKRYKLPVLLDEQASSWVLYPQVRRFIATIADREGIPDLGLQPFELSKIVHPEFLAPVLGAPTLVAGLRELSAVVRRSQNSGVRIWVEPAQEQARLCVALPLPRSFPGHVLSETRTLRMAERIVGHFAGPNFEPSRVLLTSHPQDVHFDLEKAYEGVPVYTAQGCSAIEFPRMLLDKGATTGPEPTPEDMNESALALQLDSSASTTLSRCLGPYLCLGYPSINFAAGLFGCSVRTLQRRLQQEGTSYSDVVENVRRQSAMRVLANGDRSLVELAGLLGYSEHSAFTRAFRRWTGITPVQFRTETQRPTLH